MTCCNSSNTNIGSSPSSIKWDVVRGDTASLLIEFLDDDEVTYFDTTGWEYTSTVFDPKTSEFYELEVTPDDGFVTVIATPDITESWGTGINPVVNELKFDLQVVLPDDTTWTPIIGVVRVLGDVTGGSL